MIDLAVDYEIDYVYETSDDFVADLDWLAELAHSKPPGLDLRFEICARADGIKPETLSYLQMIGAYEIFIGMKSGQVKSFLECARDHNSAIIEEPQSWLTTMAFCCSPVLCLVFPERRKRQFNRLENLHSA